MRQPRFLILFGSAFAVLFGGVVTAAAQEPKAKSSEGEKLVEVFKGSDRASFSKVMNELQGKLSKGGAVAEELARDLLELPAEFVSDDVTLKLLRTIADNGKPVVAAELLLRIVQSRSTVKALKRGNVVVGQLIVADGVCDPELVMAQMPILTDGYFAGEIGDVKRPLCFRAHGYQNLDVPLEGKNGDVFCVGKVTLKPLTDEQKASLKGKVTLDAAKSSGSAVLTINMNVGPVNTPHNGYSPRRRWPEAITVPVSENGEFSISGLSPSGYFVQVTAKDHVQYRNTVKFNPGEQLDVGTYRLFANDLGFYVGKPAPKSGELAWEKDYETALSRAKAEKKPLMVMMTATWCGPCKMLEKQTLDEPWTRYFLSEFVIVKAYEDKDVEKTYGLTGYPTLVFTDSEGKAAYTTVGYKEVLPFAMECAKAYRKLNMKTPSELQTLIEKKIIVLDGK
jgi:thiol-disulfide isomerase/thioredoxin